MSFPKNRRWICARLYIISLLMKIMLYCDMSSSNINMQAEQFLSFSAPFRPRSKTFVGLAGLAKWNKATPPFKNATPSPEIHDAFLRGSLRNYPPVNKHSNGKSPSWKGNTSSNGGFSIAMLDYRSVLTICFFFDQYPIHVSKKKHPPETNILHLKRSGWKMILSFWVLACMIQNRSLPGCPWKWC